jgi:hypothetical protein
MPVMTSTASGTDARKSAALSAFHFHPKLWIVAALLLALPAVGMQVTREINWGLEDFGAFALMLAGLCLAIEAAMNWLTALRWRVAALTLAMLIFLTIWVHLAVNLFA